MGISVDDYSSVSDRQVNSKYYSNKINTEVTDDDATGYLDFDDYLKVLTAQMSNQDFNNAMSDSEFIQQMASYSMMEAISQLSKQSALTYTSSLIGKAVTVSTGKEYETGLVEAVTVTKNGCQLLVNGGLFEADSITDVLDGDVFANLHSFVGHTVEILGEDKNITGKVEAVVIKNGEGYVVLENGDYYSLSSIVNIVTPESGGESSEGGESTGDKENTENKGGESGTAQVNEAKAESGNTAYSTARVRSALSSDSKASFDTLMDMLDGKTNSNGVENLADMAAGQAIRASASRLTYRTAQVEEPIAVSGLNGDTSRIPAPSSYDRDYEQSGQSGSQSYTQEDYQGSRSVNRLKDASPKSGYDSGDDYGVTSVNLSDAESTSLQQYKQDLSSSQQSSSLPVSTRKYADKYPLEAAFADEMGTNMVDIRFIGNTTINSRIDTSEILCYSEKGRAVTDIGWCGKGILGEVVTFADGTQRVEIIGPTEVSYLYTSGDLTLDEICNPDAKPGSLAGKLTPFETAIRHYATEYTAAEEAEMKLFGEYCARHALIHYNEF